MMKEEDKMLGAMPCNDRALFLEEDGFIHERIGIVWKADRAAGCESPCFVDRDGFIYEPVPVSEGENSLIIANIGDTVRPEALAFLPAQMYHPDTVFSKVESFGVKIDRTHLSETLKVFFEGFYCNGVCLVVIKTTDGTIVMDSTYGDRFDLSNEDENYCYHDSNGNLGKNPYHLITCYLMAYSKLLGKKVNFEIYFRKYTPDIYEYEKKNLVVREYEEKCLGEIRKTIKENLNADWEREQNKVDENPHQQELNQQKVASKYDKDPNLME